MQFENEIQPKKYCDCCCKEIKNETPNPMVDWQTLCNSCYGELESHNHDWQCDC
jgi:hypothetical protein